MLVHGLRLGVLSLRFQDIQSQLNRVQDLQKKRDMYDELGTQSWPMTKLLSDLATNTPESIELNSIRINFDESINVNGLAKPYTKYGMDLTGTEDHYKAVVVSPVFEGKATMERHRAVFDILEAELKSGEVHALTLKTYTPEQYEKL